MKIGRERYILLKALHLKNRQQRYVLPNNINKTLSLVEITLCSALSTSHCHRHVALSLFLSLSLFYMRLLHISLFSVLFWSRFLSFTLQASFRTAGCSFTEANVILEILYFLLQHVVDLGAQIYLFALLSLLLLLVVVTI